MRVREFIEEKGYPPIIKEICDDILNEDASNYEYALDTLDMSFDGGKLYGSKPYIMTLLNTLSFSSTVEKYRHFSDFLSILAAEDSKNAGSILKDITKLDDLSKKIMFLLVKKKQRYYE